MSLEAHSPIGILLYLNKNSCKGCTFCVIALWYKCIFSTRLWGVTEALPHLGRPTRTPMDSPHPQPVLKAWHRDAVCQLHDVQVGLSLLHAVCARLSFHPSGGLGIGSDLGSGLPAQVGSHGNISMGHPPPLPTGKLILIFPVSDRVQGIIVYINLFLKMVWVESPK